MDRYFLRDILIFLTYLAAVQWGLYIERSDGCTPAQNAFDFTPRCYSLPIVEDLQSPKETEGAEGAEGARKRWDHERGPVQYVKGHIVDGSRREADTCSAPL
jgi:hypothetical protein